jgi:hypothetical protein
MNAYRLAHYLFLGRAIVKGPKAFLGYAIRRASRRETWHLTRKLK